jgi:hypothetical protein
MLTAVGITLIVTGAFVVVAWFAWLAFCAWLVRHTGNTRSLRDAAVIARAFPVRVSRRIGPRRKHVGKKLARRTRQRS